MRQCLAGGLYPSGAVQDPPELEDAYPENADSHHVRADKTTGVSTFVLDDVDDFTPLRQPPGR